MDAVTTDVAPATAPAESSPAPTPEVPRDAKAYREWRQTGKLPGEAKPKAEPAPAKKESSEPSDTDGESSPASEADVIKQEKKPRSNAETRLKELLDDLKRAGLSPAELKTFKREAQVAAKAETTEASPKPPEHTAKPAGQPKPPGWEDTHPKPKLEDFSSIEEWADSLTDWKTDKRDFEANLRRQAEAQQKEINDKLSQARERYGEAADSTIATTAKTVFNDSAIAPAVKAVINDSPVLVDLLYVMGSKEADLTEFVELAKTNPGKAIRKAVLLERLVEEELAQGAAASESGTPERAEDGKFVSKEKTPATKVTKAPPPPREASGRSAAPPDEIESAVRANDFLTYRHAANRRDIARHQGR